MTDLLLPLLESVETPPAAAGTRPPAKLVSAAFEVADPVDEMREPAAAAAGIDVPDGLKNAVACDAFLTRHSMLRFLLRFTNVWQPGHFPRWARWAWFTILAVSQLFLLRQTIGSVAVPCICVFASCPYSGLKSRHFLLRFLLIMSVVVGRDVFQESLSSADQIWIVKPANSTNETSSLFVARVSGTFAVPAFLAFFPLLFVSRYFNCDNSFIADPRQSRQRIFRLDLLLRFVNERCQNSDQIQWFTKLSTPLIAYMFIVTIIGAVDFTIGAVHTTVIASAFNIL
jgi:hypothetical protein